MAAMTKLKTAGTPRPADTVAPIDAATARTLPHLFHLRVTRSPDAPAYRQFESGVWRHYRWRDMAALVARWRAALSAEGLAPGDRVAVSLPNGVDWICFDQAALSLGLVTVPLYTTDSPGNLAHILTDSNTRLVLLDSELQWDGLRTHVGGLPDLRRVLCRQIGGTGGDPRLRALPDWLSTLTAVADTASWTDHPQEPDALATLIYTSGTTGMPKGVMLSHGNLLGNADAVIRRIPPLQTDVFLSFLPLAHAFERTVGYYLPMMIGCSVAYARSIEQLREDLLQVRPTVLLSVPRVYDKIYLAIQEKLGATGMKRRLFEATVRLGLRRLEAAQGRGSPPGPLDRLRWAALDHLVARKVRGRLGGRLRVAVSGGAPLSPTVGQFFAGLGLPLTEGYGLTEAAPTVTGIPPAGFRPGWVGPPLPGVEVRLGPRDELLVRGPNVGAGYWRQPEATAQAIDTDGWLHTGDIGEIAVDGQIGIRGRLKEIIVTSTGENIPPTDMESALTMDPLFDQAMVIGEGRQFLAAILVLGEGPWQRLATDLGLDPHDPASLMDSRTLVAARARVDARLAGFPGYAQVRAVHLTREPWTIGNGLITPTMKLKRPEVMDRFATTIDAMYGPSAPGGNR